MAEGRRNPLLESWPSRLVHGIEFAGAAVLQVPFRLLPTDSRIRLAGAIGRLVVPRLPSTRRRIERNLARAMPELAPGGRAAVARAVGDNFGRVIAEYDLLPALARQPGRARVSGEGLAPLRAARAAGRGAVLVSAHFGNWEAIRLGLRHEGIEVAMIYRAFNNPPFDAYVRARMRAAGEPVLTKGRTGMRALVTHVMKGGAALILVDQKQTGAPLLPFLGLPAETVPAAAELATRADVPLLPAFGTRRADGLGFEVEIEAPVPAGPAEARMAEVNARIGARIRALPGQWFWLHNRWR